MQYNQQQTAAIDTRGNGVKNILVSAGAGSGKTAVLAERVLSIITDTTNNTDIDNMLIMTFTINAAAEMRGRIASKLKEKRNELIIREPDSDKLKNIQKQLVLLNKASITTIDSFCNSLVKRYFYMLDIDPVYRIAGNESCNELMKISTGILDELFEEKIEDEEFIDLVEFFSPQSHRIKDLYDVIHTIDRKLASLPYPNKWLEEYGSFYLMDEKRSCNAKILNKLKEYIISLCDPYREEMDEYLTEANELYSKNASLLEEIRGNTDKNKFLVYYDALNRFNPLFKITSSWDPNYGFILDIFKSPPPNFGALNTGKLTEELKEFCKDVNGFIKTVRDIVFNPLMSFFSDLSPDEMEQVQEKVSNIANTLLKFYMEYADKYDKTKKELGVFSFSDLTHFCIKILYNEDGTLTEAAYELRNKYTDVIVDEYQDNNQLQEEILKAITTDNLFMVGDVKQSIYSFREACPELFTEKYNSYSEYTPGQKGNILIKLNQNYRSRAQVLNLSNFLFYQLMSKDFGGIDYDRTTALVAGFEFPQPPDEIADRICQKNELLYYIKKNDGFDDMTNDEIQASIIAKRISELINPADPKCQYVYDKKKKEYRICHLSDIAIIINKLSNVGENYVNILSKYGIPAKIKNSTSLFRTIEVKTIMSLLKIIDNPYRDIDLITVLHSPVIGVSLEEIALIRATDKRSALYDNMLGYIEKGNDNILRSKLDKLKDIIRQAHILIHSMPFAEVLDRLYSMTDYINYVRLLKNGDLRLKNLKAFYASALNIYSSGIHSFNGVVAELCSLENENPSVDMNIVSGNTDAVTIMTIHSSKGLEFPIVFIPRFSDSLKRTGKQNNSSYADRSFILDANEGFAFDYLNSKTRQTFPTIAKKLIKIKTEKKELTEKLRLLYVALTRAEEKLILVGDTSQSNSFDTDKPKYGKELWDGIHIPSYIVEDAGSFMKWLLISYQQRDIFNKKLKNMGINEIHINDIFDIKHISRDYITLTESDMSSQRIPTINKDNTLDETITNILSADLSSIYTTTLPSKISISEIKRQRMADEYARLEDKLYSEVIPNARHILTITEAHKDEDTKISFDEPEFTAEAKTSLAGVQKGTAYHTVFEHLKLDANATMDMIREQINALRKRDILSEAAVNSIDGSKFYKYLHSDLGQRICASNKVYRETPFVMQLSPAEIYPDAGYEDKGDRILVHGIIDLFFEEEDHIILVDYKTDRVDEKNTPENICQRYRLQLEYYKTALERSYNKPVKEMYLYLVAIDKSVLVAKY